MIEQKLHATQSRLVRLSLGLLHLAFAGTLFLASTASAKSGSTDSTTEEIKLLYPNGNPRWTYQVQKGAMQGLSEFYYESGRLMTSGDYDRGLKHGLFVYYRPDGSVREKVLYVYGERKWRSSLAGKAAKPPLSLLEVEEADKPKVANTSVLKEWATPFLPFTTLDRIGKRIGMTIGTSTESDQRPNRRAEIFGHVVRGRFGVYFAANQTWISGPGDMRKKDGSRKEVYFEEQGTVQGWATVSLLKESHIRGAILRLGYLGSFDSNPLDNHEIRGNTGVLRASDFVSTFPDASAKRLSGSFFSNKGLYSTQVDLGLDFLSYTPVGTDRDTSSAILRVNGGVAYGRYHWQVGLETSNSINSKGESLLSAGATATYVTDSLIWASFNFMSDQHFEQAYTLSIGSWLWRVD